jgi:hypothetical protein
MPSADVGTAIAGAGVSIQKTITITTDAAVGLEVTLPVAHALSSWVKTDADTAAGNLTAGHGHTTGTYDVYWTGGQRLGVAGTITINAIALEGGAGTDFPASSDATVVVCEQVSINAAVDGDELELLAVSLEYGSTVTSTGNLDCQSAVPASVEAVALEANTPQVWTGAAARTKFTGDPITTIKATHSNTSLTATLKVIALQDSTP